MHGRKWHDHEEPHDLERVSENEGNEAVLEAESSGERKGMGRSKAGGSQGRERRKRTVPPGKGLAKSAVKRGKTSKAAKKPSMSGTRKKAAPKGSRRI